MHKKKLVSILTVLGLGEFLYASSPWLSIMENTKSSFSLLISLGKENINNYLTWISNIKFNVSLVDFKNFFKLNQKIFPNLHITSFNLMFYFGVMFLFGSFIFLIIKISKASKPEKFEGSILSLFNFKYHYLKNSDLKKDKVDINFVEDEYLRNNPDITLFKDYDSLIGRIHQGQIPVALEGDENDKYYFEKDVEDESFKIFISNSFNDSYPFVSD